MNVRFATVQLSSLLGATPALVMRDRASACSLGVSHQGFALLGRPGKIRKPARAIGREITPSIMKSHLQPAIPPTLKLVSRFVMPNEQIAYPLRLLYAAAWR